MCIEKDSELNQLIQMIYQAQIYESTVPSNFGIELRKKVGNLLADQDLNEWKKHPQEILQKIEKSIPYPLFVKAPHLGSSIGVSKATNNQELIQGIETALQVDTQVLVEKEIQGREIEFAILGNDQLTVFPPGEIFSSGEVYNYEKKYGDTPILNGEIEWIPSLHEPFPIPFLS